MDLLSLVFSGYFIFHNFNYSVHGIFFHLILHHRHFLPFLMTFYKHYFVGILLYNFYNVFNHSLLFVFLQNSPYFSIINNAAVRIYEHKILFSIFFNVQIPSIIPKSYQFVGAFTSEIISTKFRPHKTT